MSIAVWAPSPSPSDLTARRRLRSSRFAPLKRKVPRRPQPPPRMRVLRRLHAAINNNHSKQSKREQFFDLPIDIKQHQGITNDRFYSQFFQQRVGRVANLLVYLLPLSLIHFGHFEVIQGRIDWVDRLRCPMQILENAAALRLVLRQLRLGDAASVIVIM